MSSETTPNPQQSQNTNTEETGGPTSQATDGGRTQKGTEIQAAGRTIATSKKSRLSTIAERQQNTAGPGDEESNPEEESNADEVLGLLRAAPGKPTQTPGTGQKRALEEIEDPSDEEEQAAILKKAMAAQRKGDDARAEMFFDILADLKAKSTLKPTEANPYHGALIPQKSLAMVGISSTEPQIKEGGLSFYGKGVNTFQDMGLPTFFDKNMKELKGPIPLTIFNKKWQDAAVLFHADKRTKSDDSSETKDRYSGLKFQNEWEQSFSDWTINHRAFHLALRDIYRFPTFAGWLLVHKANCDRMQAKDGFMTALRYDIQLRTNVFAHRVVINGDPSVPDISVLRTDIAESCYAEARNFDELGFRDTNPYAAGGPRAHLDPLTCLPKPGKQPFTKNHQTQNLTSHGQLPQQGYYNQQPTYGQYQPPHHNQGHYQQPTFYQPPTGGNNHPNQKQSDQRAPKSGGYKGKNFIPNYQDHRRGAAQPPNQNNGQMVLSSQS
ncbi:uncharacterized protein PGTG_03738 [Puccinia graminis f. sp. tritici CRL 75-36-700-3]|uniref:Uncharacterized protein n=1 Tax=Puccinia graminis f. sp. tritici (strain CRL 75-36-700-3 / race SCCL) TaxID=418459 RepID=E3K0F7_PUCGT|nr:uncharacterized protein PGTG_03738 [Puccinia graminis f. sp. tritici CRL 75-36-700-3]EFP77782.1 hypothetical protein PGTG_03738 [Puccinia graminis f. sp. tritici CRL 75-36-700-3]